MADSIDPMETGEAPRRPWAHVVEPLVYGTLSVLIVVAGLEVARSEVDAVGTGLIILAGSVATWLAHTYATIMGEGVTPGESITRRQILHRLRDDGPIVLAGIPAAIAVGGATIDLWTLPTAITATNVAGVVVLAVTGLAAARNRGSGPLATIVSVIVATSLGLGVIAVELALHD